MRCKKCAALVGEVSYVITDEVGDRSGYHSADQIAKWDSIEDKKGITLCEKCGDRFALASKKVEEGAKIMKEYAEIF